MTDPIKASALPLAGALQPGDIVYLVQSISGVETSVQTTVGAIVEAAVSAVGTIPDSTKVVHATITGAHTYDPATDAGKVIRHNDSTATTATIDTHANKAFATDQVVSSRQIGDGQLTIAALTGVTLNVPTGCVAKTRAKGSTVMLHYIGSDEWDLTGDLASA